MEGKSEGFRRDDLARKTKREAEDKLVHLVGVDVARAEVPIRAHSVNDNPQVPAIFWACGRRSRRIAD